MFGEDGIYYVNDSIRLVILEHKWWFLGDLQQKLRRELQLVVLIDTWKKLCKFINRFKFVALTVF